MPKFIVEREILGIGGAAPEGLRSAAEKSNEVLNELGPNIQWVESYIAGDKTYCIYIAPNEEIVREHARLGGFPADRISRVTATIDRTTAES